MSNAKEEGTWDNSESPIFHLLSRDSQRFVNISVPVLGCEGKSAWKRWLGPVRHGGRGAGFLVNLFQRKNDFKEIKGKIKRKPKPGAGGGEDNYGQLASVRNEKALNLEAED